MKLFNSFAILFSVSAASSGLAADKPNILLIIADDMRPELGCYGVEDILTPNIDKLATKGTVFRNAYCNIPVSGASRASLLTGVYPRYPDRFMAFDASAAKDDPQAVPLPRLLKDNGYYCLSNGKVFHQITDHASAWSESPWRLHPNGYGADWAEYNKWELWQNGVSADYVNANTKRGPFCESADVPDTAYDDGRVTLQTIADLRKLKDMDQPFFLACGFWRPHLPFNAPKKYWDLYDRNQIKLATNQYRPQNLPSQVKTSTEIKGYGRIPSSLQDVAFQREAKHGYYACVSYIDAQIGMVLSELESLGMAENTIVIILGDHGWHLGEHAFWGKHNLMNHSTHAPLIIRVPGGTPGNAPGIVEFVDIYPTLCELCGIIPPRQQLQGKSMLPILQDPSRRIKEGAFVQWSNGCNMVTEEYSYAVWYKDGVEVADMLFDRVADAAENMNISGQENGKKICRKISCQMKVWKKEIGY